MRRRRLEHITLLEYNCTDQHFLATLNSDDGEMVIQGSGEYSSNFSGYSAAPWYDDGALIKTIRIRNVPKLPDYLIYGLSNLTSITLESDVYVFSPFAIQYCSRLETVIIEGTDTSMGSMYTSGNIYHYAAMFNYSYSIFLFGSCEKLTTITLPSDHKYWKFENGALYSKSGKTMIWYPPSKETVTIPSDVETISYGCFFNVWGRDEISIPANVRMFFGGHRTKQLVFEPRSTPIYVDTHNCSSLKSVTGPEWQGRDPIGWGKVYINYKWDGTAPEPTETADTILDLTGLGGAANQYINADDTLDISANLAIPLYQLEYTISYNANGGTLGSVPESEVFDDTKIVIPADSPSRDGYRFLGWAYSADASSATEGPGNQVVVAGDTTFYAIWTRLLTISYDATGGSPTPDPDTGTSSETTSPLYRTTIAAAPKRSGYVFMYWTDSPPE